MSEIDRLKELIEKNALRIKELGKSIETTLDSFSQESKNILDEAERISAVIEESDKRIAGYDANILTLEQKRQGLKSEASFLEQKIREADKKISSLNSDINSNSKDIIKVQDNIKQLSTKIDAVKAEIDGYDKTVAELQQSTQATRDANEKEAIDLNTGFVDAQRKLNELSEKEPTVEFLLTDSASEPPEVSIIAAMIEENAPVPIDSLKKTTRVPPAIALKTIMSLEQKGIVERTSSNELKLVKTP